MSCTHDCGCTPEIRYARTDEWVQIAPESARAATLTPEQPVKAPGQGGDIFLTPEMVAAHKAFMAGWKAAREDVPWLVSEVERLERWKAEALEVMSGLRELGKALGLGLGVQITGPAALAEVARLTAERDALAAQVARVEEVLDHWRTVDEGNAAYAERIGERSRFADGLASRADMLRAALAGPEADTSDTQPTDQEDQS